MKTLQERIEDAVVKQIHQNITEDELAALASHGISRSVAEDAIVENKLNELAEMMAKSLFVQAGLISY